MENHLVSHAQVKTILTNIIISMENRKNVRHFSKYIMGRYNMAVTRNVYSCL